MSEWRHCFNCKHNAASVFNEPCRTCGTHATQAYHLWTPKGTPPTAAPDSSTRQAPLRELVDDVKRQSALMNRSWMHAKLLVLCSAFEPLMAAVEADEKRRMVGRAYLARLNGARANEDVKPEVFASAWHIADKEAEIAHVAALALIRGEGECES